jgi:hypothetical protein
MVKQGFGKEAHMLADEDREYHTERAREELDSAYKAENTAAAEAHLKLSSLHMQRLQALGEDGASGNDNSHP